MLGPKVAVTGKGSADILTLEDGIIRWTEENLNEQFGDLHVEGDLSIKINGQKSNGSKIRIGQASFEIPGTVQYEAGTENPEYLTTVGGIRKFFNRIKIRRNGTLRRIPWDEIFSLTLPRGTNAPPFQTTISNLTVETPSGLMYYYEMMILVERVRPYWNRDLSELILLSEIGDLNINPANYYASFKLDGTTIFANGKAEFGGAVYNGDFEITGEGDGVAHLVSHSIPGTARIKAGRATLNLGNYSMIRNYPDGIMKYGGLTSETLSETEITVASSLHSGLDLDESVALGMRNWMQSMNKRRLIYCAAVAGVSSLSGIAGSAYATGSPVYPAALAAIPLSYLAVNWLFGKLYRKAKDDADAELVEGRHQLNLSFSGTQASPFAEQHEAGIKTLLEKYAE